MSENPTSLWKLGNLLFTNEFSSYEFFQAANYYKFCVWLKKKIWPEPEGWILFNIYQILFLWKYIIIQKMFMETFPAILCQWLNFSSVHWSWSAGKIRKITVKGVSRLIYSTGSRWLLWVFAELKSPSEGFEEVYCQSFLAKKQAKY